MVMFKARFQAAAAAAKPRAQQQQQPQPTPPMPKEQPAVPPIEDERGPQHPVREPGPRHEPERVS